MAGKMPAGWSNLTNLLDLHVCPTLLGPRPPSLTCDSGVISRVGLRDSGAYRCAGPPGPASPAAAASALPGAATAPPCTPRSFCYSRVPRSDSLLCCSRPPPAAREYWPAAACAVPAQENRSPPPPQPVSAPCAPQSPTSVASHRPAETPRPPRPAPPAPRSTAEIGI